MTKPLPYPKGLGSSSLWRQLRAACEELELLERWQLTRPRQINEIRHYVERAYLIGATDTSTDTWQDLANKIIDLTEIS